MIFLRLILMTAAIFGADLGRVGLRSGIWGAIIRRDHFGRQKGHGRSHHDDYGQG